MVAESDRVADRAAQLGPGLLGDPLGERPRRDPPRLGVPDQTTDTTADGQADLRQLGRLTGTGLAGDDDDLVVADGLGQVVRALGRPAVPAGR